MQSGITQTQLSKIEKNKAEITLFALARLLYALNLSVLSLFSEGIIDLGSPLPKLYYQPESKKQEVPTLSLYDIHILDEFALLTIPRTREITSWLLRSFILQYQPTIESDIAKLVSVQAIPFLCIRTEKLVNPLPTMEVIKYPPDFNIAKLRSIYLSDGLLILQDLGHYIHYHRISQKLSLRNLGSQVGLTHVALSKIEFRATERTRFIDIINLDLALGLQGELIALAMRTAEMYVGIGRMKYLNHFPPKAWTKTEATLIEELVIVSRLFQHFFPNKNNWSTAYRDLESRRFLSADLQ
jgi:transcriptional regulator with XRE-family HTH domain